MSKGQTVLAILLLLSIVSCFLPWITAKVRINGADHSTTNYGYDYIVPLGAPYTTSVSILNVLGFILSAFSFKVWQRIARLSPEEKDTEQGIQETFKATRRIRRLNAIAGILILIGVIAAFIYTSDAAIAKATGSVSYSVSVSAEYGMGLEALFGFLLIIIGARTEV